MRLRQLLKQNAMKEEAALLGAGSLQGVPEQDLQVTLCFAQEDKVWNLNSPRAEDVGSGVQVPALEGFCLTIGIFNVQLCKMSASDRQQ